MSQLDYQPIPECVAAAVSGQYRKDIVIVLAFDAAHKRWDVTTFGQASHDKALAVISGSAAACAVSDGFDQSLDVARNTELVRRLVEGIEAWSAENGGLIPEPLCEAYAAATQALRGGSP